MLCPQDHYDDERNKTVFHNITQDHSMQDQNRFLPRDAMCKRGVCSHAVSVCLSVTLVYFIQTAEDIVKHFSWPGSAMILVILPRAPILNSAPFSGGAKYTEGGKFLRFDWNLRLSRKRYEIGQWLLWNVNRKSYALYRMVTFSMTLTNPNPVFKAMAFLKSNISKTARLRN